MMGWPVNSWRGSRISLHNCWRAGMYCDGTRLSMPRRVAVAERSNSESLKCGDKSKSFIMD